MFLGFEDAFTDLQSEVVSLCLEFLANANVNAEKIYIYIYQTKRQRMFNAFFNVAGSVVSAGEIGTEEQSDEFLDVGTDDIERLIALCDKYQHPCPNEFKLVYDVKSKNFDSHYGYEDYSEKDEVDSVDVFLEWIKVVKKENQ